MVPYQPVLRTLKAGLGLLVGALALLFQSGESDEMDTDERPLSEGSELFGEYNFRTGKLDAGTDPDGWYEEDM